jgi:hypothetical protein
VFSERRLNEHRHAKTFSAATRPHTAFWLMTSEASAVILRLQTRPLVLGVS